MIKVIRRLLVGALALLTVLQIGMLGAAASERVVKDALNRDVQIGENLRILTLGSDVSEIVVALGAEGRIIGVDRGSTYPDSLKSKPNVGYRRSTNAEGIVSLAPDLILASEDVATPQVLEAWKAFGIPVVFVRVENSLEGLRSKIRFLADVLGKPAEGDKLEKHVVEDFEAAERFSASIPEAKRKKVIFFHGLLRFTAAGKGTAADAIIRYAGGINPVTYEGYKSLSEELMLGMDPDTILMLPNADGGPTTDQAFANVALQNTKAGRSKSLVVLQGAYMINFGPRTAEAIKSLAAALYSIP